MSLRPELPIRIGHNQFLLGPAPLCRDSWRSLELAEDLVLSHQENLHVGHVADGQRTLTLIGYILDCFDPDADNDEILNRLIEESPDLDACIRATNDLGGRWILIYKNGAETSLFHDAAGLRQVCFVKETDRDKLWVGSHTGLLREVSGLDFDKAATAFAEAMARKDPEYWWPGNRLPLESAKSLLPNHYLDLKNGVDTRYWPHTSPGNLSKTECCRSVGAKLSGVIQAANNRGPLTLGLSAGWDSRLLLAASKSVIKDMNVYTAQGSGMPDDHYDIAVPQRLAARLELDHEIVHPPTSASDEFTTALAKHSWNPHPRFAPGAQADIARYRYSKTAVIGNLSEVAKLPYRNQPESTGSLDGHVLARLIGMGDETFAIEALDEWLDDAQDIAGYSTLDLFYWEQRMGRWLAANLVEFDVAWKEVFVPFNIRSLICDFLATDEKERAPDSLHLYLAIMESMWPEVLLEPINPIPGPSLSTRIRRKIRRLVSR